MNRTQTAMQAVRAAARLRAKQGYEPDSTLCPFDLAEDLGIIVRLVALSSLEGMYSPAPRPTVLISAERPPGRRRYTCSHEIGHHVFGHGTRLDELVNEAPPTRNPQEFIAQRFAGALLMPKLTVESAFARRGWAISTATPENLFVIAQDIGVGYSTLVDHLEWTLCVIPGAISRRLRRVPLARIRSALAGFAITHDLFVADEKWGQRPIDIEVGDVVLVPKAAIFQGNCAIMHVQPTPHLQALTPGIGSVALTATRALVSVRVSQREFKGLARYRYLEEMADEEQPLH